MTLSQENLRAAWHSFISGHNIDHSTVRPVICKSWERCFQAKVDPLQRIVSAIANDNSLEQRLAANKEWLDITRPVMKTLYSFVEGSGFIVSVADRDGYILDIIGDSDVVQTIARGNFIIGANWSELSAGTNGIGTPLQEDSPLQIFSYEHYCICSHRWTGSAATIHDAKGQQVGVVNMTGSFEKVHPHTLGMVVAGANSIERQLAAQRVWYERDLANRVREALMESISEGILATDRNQKIVHINREAAKFFGTSADQVIGKDINDVLDVRSEDWKAVLNGKKFKTDWEQDVVTPARTIKLTVTSRPIRTSDGRCDGIVIVLNEISRARKLAQRMSGAIARLSFNDMIGQDAKYLESICLARSAAGSDSTVLLLGESGTGKDVMAQAIHNASYRADGPFVAINCGAIPRDLIGSELFGYTEGAFTGAKKGGSPGKFELADGGTIFLDEIGDMPPELQTTLLRVLEQKAVTRIGGTKVANVNVRVIAATNRNLLADVENGNFRRDLYYRLNVVTINLVPLRERQGDIGLLMRHFVQRISKTFGKGGISIADNVWPVVKSYKWPGNIRELQNVVERALHLVENSTLDLESLPQEIKVRKSMSESCVESTISAYEKELIKKSLLKHGGNLSQVAIDLGMARTTLYRKLSKYRLSKNFNIEELG